MQRVHEASGVTFLEHAAGDERLEVKIVGGLSRAGAEAMAEDRAQIFQSVFEIRRTAYPGQQTTFIDCPPRFKPERQQRSFERGFVDAFTGYANANRVAGACTEDLARYRLVYAHVYCGDTKRLMLVSYYAPRDADALARRFVEGLGCDSR